MIIVGWARVQPLLDREFSRAAGMDLGFDWTWQGSGGRVGNRIWIVASGIVCYTFVVWCAAATGVGMAGLWYAILASSTGIIDLDRGSCWRVAAVGLGLRLLRSSPTAESTEDIVPARKRTQITKRTGDSRAWKQDAAGLDFLKRLRWNGHRSSHFEIWSTTMNQLTSGAGFWIQYSLWCLAGKRSASRSCLLPLFRI